MRSLQYLLIILVLCGLAYGEPDVGRYNVEWDTPSKDSSGSMPIGNGDIGLNVWVNPAGELVFYISKTDSWSENARLLKLGLVRIKLTPSLPVGDAFRQTLKLEEGEIEIIVGRGEDKRVLRVWVDANKPIIFVEALGDKAFGFQADLEVWRKAQRELKGAEASSARGLTRNDQDEYPKAELRQGVSVNQPRPPKVRARPSPRQKSSSSPTRRGWSPPRPMSIMESVQRSATSLQGLMPPMEEH